MIKKILTVILLMGSVLLTPMYANGPFDITLHIIKLKDADGGNTKAPARPLVITLEDNVLTMPARDVDFLLELRDDTDTVVYTTFLPAGSTQVTLPSTLSGDFEIRLVTNTYYYIGVTQFS